MTDDLTNEEIDQFWHECERNHYKFARLIVAYTERRNMYPGITSSANQDYFEQYPED